jgi:ABC-type multidrug transport system ATPase subunit
MPSAGTLRYGDAASGAEIRGRVGLLAHELHLYPELTARQNLEFFASLHGLGPRLVVPAALEAAGLEDRASDDVATFSRGMRQRLALERSLLHRPRLVLLDEPFTGLDDRGVTMVVDRIKRVAAEGAIVVVATHDLDLSEGLVTRAVVVRDGRLISDEPAGSGLRERYRTLVGSAQ